MSDEKRSDVHGGDGPEAGTKRPYEKPSIAWVEKLGVKPVLAVACARTVLEGPICEAGGLAS